MSEPQTLLDDTVTEFKKENHTVGVAAALWFDQAQYFKVSGHNSENGAEVSIDSVFTLQSVQKAFTGLLFAHQLLDKKMQLSCVRAAEYLPIGKPSPAKWIWQVQPWELATHTSGMPYASPGSVGQDLYAGKPPSQDFIDWWEGFQPPTDTLMGCTWAYSNPAVVTLAYATAHAAGTTYPSLFKSLITDPWKLTSTVLDFNEVPEDRRVTGYQDGQQMDPTLGVKSSASDMLNFMLYHLKELGGQADWAVVDRVLTPIWHRSALQTNVPDGMGIVWQITNSQDGSPENTLYAKDGGGSGFSTWVGLLPGRRAGVTFLANSNVLDKRFNWYKLGTELLSGLFSTQIGTGSAELAAVEE